MYGVLELYNRFYGKKRYNDPTKNIHKEDKTSKLPCCVASLQQQLQANFVAGGIVAEVRLDLQTERIIAKRDMFSASLLINKRNKVQGSQTDA